MLDATVILVYNGRKYGHISSLLRDLHWLRVPERIKAVSSRLFCCVHCRSRTAIA